MIDLVLVLVIAFLICLLGFVEYQNRKERAKMLNLIVSKDNKEAVNLQLADQTKIEPAQETEAEKQLKDIKALDELSDDEYDKFIQSQLNN